MNRLKSALYLIAVALGPPVELFAAEKAMITLHSAVNVRAAPGGEGTVLGQVGEKEEVQLLDEKVLPTGEKWLKIQIRRHPGWRETVSTGWVLGKYFVPVDSLTGEAPEPEEKGSSVDCPSCDHQKKEISRTVRDFEKIAEKIAGRRESGFIWPVAGDLRSGFGNRLHPIKRVIKFHKGIDLAGNNGKAVKAVKAGRVTLAYRGCKTGKKRCNGGGGNWIEIAHADGLRTRYLHMGSRCRLPKIGDLVKQGDSVGCVGATGAVTGPHLHFRVLKNGKYINPLSALPKKRVG